MTPIIILGTNCDATRIIYHYLIKNKFNINAVVLEEPIAKIPFLKRRAKRLGYPTVLGQVAFQGLVVPYLKRTSAKRMQAIEAQYGFNKTAIPTNITQQIASVNSSACRIILKALQPRIVVVSGTRIIGKKTLTSMAKTQIQQSIWVNMHAGITPAYRGVHGGYWALAKKDAPHCGVTVHLVDKGIDTGNVLGQTLIRPTKKDNFTTYPLLQLGEGLPLLKQAIENILADNLTTIAPLKGTESGLWSHPTLWEYWRNGVK